MRFHRHPIAILLTISCASAAARALRAQAPVARRLDSTVECGIAASPHRVTTIDLGSGGSLIVRGWEHDSIHVRVHLAGRDWRDTKVFLDRTPAGPRLRSTLGGSALDKSTSHEFELWVPRYSDIELQSSGGNVAIVDVNGRLRGETRGGSLTLDRVFGSADLSTRGGPIQVSDSHLDGRVTTRGGVVRADRVTGGVRIRVENESFDDKVKRPR
jgi:hypothetical protein